MKFKNFNYLDNEYKEKFLKICLQLFPQYKSVSLRNDGTIVFISNKKFFKRNKVVFEQLVSRIIERLSALRWNSSDLINPLLKELESNLSTYNQILYPNKEEQLKAIIIIIEFLYKNFTETKSTNDIKDCNLNIKLVHNKIIVYNDSLNSTFATSLRTGIEVLQKTKPFFRIRRNFILLYIGVIFTIATSMNILYNLPFSTNYSSVYSSVLHNFPWKIWKL